MISVNQRFGHVTVLAFSHSSGKRQMWSCQCDCGEEFLRRADVLLNSKFCSPRCQLFVPFSTHGMGKHPAYRVWCTMRDRCNRPLCEQWPNYGGRGIKVCDRWQNSFPNFWEDMGADWKKGLKIERKNNDGDYSPENCVWTTQKGQARNMRRNIFLDTPWGRLCIQDAAVKAGVPPGMVYIRFRKGIRGEGLLLPSRRAK